MVADTPPTSCPDAQDCVLRERENEGIDETRTACVVDKGEVAEAPHTRGETERTEARGDEEGRMSGP